MIASPSTLLPKVDVAPYRGLEPYGEEDSALFFGREREVEIISANLSATRLTLLYGPSGVGKTSVLNAGVAHSLVEEARENLRAYGTPEQAVVFFRSWLDNPIASVTEAVGKAVTEALGEEPFASQLPLTSFVNDLAAWSARLNGRLLIILDQFEEYFLYHAQEDGPGTFAVEFPRAVNTADLRVNFLVSIREDALAKLDRFKAGLPDLFTNYLRLDSLDRESARAAIEKPLEVIARTHPGPSVPAAIEPELTDEVLNQVSSADEDTTEIGRGVRRDELTSQIDSSLLQVVMRRLWTEERRLGSNTLHLETFKRIGTARQILASHLDGLMSELSPEDQDLAAEVFRYLVTPSGMKIAWSASDLGNISGLDVQRIQRLMERLSGPADRILRTVAGHGDGKLQRYEIFHDRLADAILGWRTRHQDARVAAEFIRAQQLRGEGRRRASLIATATTATTLVVMFALSYVFLRPPDIYDFSASRMEVGAGSPVTLSWSVGLARTVTLEPPPVDASMTRTLTVSPSGSTEYKLTARNWLGISASRLAMVHVAEINSFQANSNSIPAGQDVTLQWDTSGASSVQVEPSGDLFQDGPGSLMVRPTEDTTYTLRALGSEGQLLQDAHLTVTVRQLPIAKFEVAGGKTSVSQGDPVQLDWSVDGASSTILSVDHGVLRGGAAATLDVTRLPPSYVVSPKEPGRTTYTLTATNTGGAVERQITLDVQRAEVNISQSLIYIQRAGAKDPVGLPKILSRTGLPQDARAFGTERMSYFGSWSVVREEIAYDVIISPTERRVFRTGPSGNVAIPVTPANWAAWNPVWSPNGIFIVFAAATPNGPGAELYTINVDTQEINQLTSNTKWHQHPSWSPDGNYIAYESDQGGAWNVWVIQVDSAGKPVSPQVQVTFGNAETQHNNPAWTPDGTGITYTIASQNQPVSVNLTLVSISGSNDTLAVRPMPARRLLDAGYGETPDGKSLLLIREMDDGKRRIYIAPLSDLSNVQPLTPEDADCGSFISIP